MKMRNQTQQQDINFVMFLVAKPIMSAFQIPLPGPK